MKMSESVLRSATLVIGGLLALFTNVSQGETVTVTTVGDSFSPKEVTIHVGDTVVWTGLANAHNVTGSTAEDLDQFCGAGVNNFSTESSCSHTFTTAGTFPYECTIHVSCCDMVGTITVLAAAPPPAPTVGITSPAAGAIFSAPAILDIAAAAAVTNGTVTNVAFFASANGVASLLGSAQVAPFNIITASLGAASYSLMAVATAAGISTTSAVVSVSVVSPVAVSNSAPAIANGQFSFTYNATVGLTYIVQNSVNLVNWSPVFTNVASSNAVQFTDSSPVNGSHYYRVVLQPNP
ncbi:MAG TPA: Ig-like domain-containing protein [Candidatus Baltobacteraceae bacterium]|jgi:plastocyanin|nr:Ig-like domain-containing protein [Candidatus Baltobacteraceae bacterium]